MAEYRLHYKKGKVGYAKEHAEYILREKKYKAKEDLIYKESGNFNLINSKLDGNLAVKFWETADYSERVNGVVYREMEIMIPNELNHNQAVEVIQNFVKKEIGNDYPYSFAIHESYNKETGAKNLHCHLMFSERKIDNIERDLEQFFKKANSKNPSSGGAKKDREWQKKERLLALRKSWEVEANLVLEKYGFEERIDCRSLKDRKEEAIKNGDFISAELLDREAINLSKKIVGKLKKVGYINLTPEEKEEVKKYNQAKEIKAQKLRNYQIKKNIIVPTSDELIEKIKKLEKLDEAALKRQTLNIISKGQLNKDLYSLRVVEKNLIAYPQNEKLLNQQKQLQTNLLTIAEEYTLTGKYNRILEQLKRDKESEISLYKSHLKEHYHINFEDKVQENQVKENQVNEEKIREKYQDKSFNELTYKLLELEQQNNEHHTMQILTKYRVEGITQNIITLNKNIGKLEQEKTNILLFGKAEDITEISNKIIGARKQVITYEKEYELITKELSKNPEKYSSLLEKINVNVAMEKKVIQQLINEKQLSKTETVQDKVKNCLDVIVKYENTKRLYEYFCDNNLTENHNKSMYILHNRLNAMEQLYVDNFNKLQALNHSKVQKELIAIGEEYLRKNEAAKKRVDILETANKNLSSLMSKEEIRPGYTAINLMALNKITKGEYALNSIKQQKTEKEIQKLEKEIKNVSFFKKYNLQKEISNKESVLNSCISKEKDMLMKYKNSPILRDKSLAIEKRLSQALGIINKKKIQAKSEVNYSTSILYKINELQNKKLQKNRDLSYRNLSHNIKQITSNLKEILRNGKEEYSRYNSFELNLEKDKEEQWEL